MFLVEFNRMVKLCPERTAVACGNESVTYSDLDNKSTILANMLRDFGVHTDSLIGYWDNRSIETIIAILGIWKAKGAYLPIDLHNPVDRVKTMVHDSGTRILIMNKARECDFAQVISLHDLFLSQYSVDDWEEPSTNPDDLAYVIYTSGSTGKPKGAMIEHKGMYNHLLSKMGILHLDESSHVAQNANIGFVISIWQLILPLMLGATTYIFSDSDAFHLRKFIRLIQTYQISVLEVVPTFLYLLLDHLKQRSITLESLKYLVVTGEEFKAALANECLAYFQDTIIINAYGPTEASDDVTHYILGSNTQYDRIPIGSCIPGMHITIVDEHLVPLPAGHRGKIVITGIGVGRGYINDQANTEKSFYHGLFSDHERSYDTNDVGYISEQSICYYCGRIDNQVNIHGFRIELEEIENRLQSIAFIKDAVVQVVSSNDNRSETLHAYILLEDPADPVCDSDIQSKLSAILPYYMIPEKYTICGSFPTGMNGKIDRTKLIERNDVRCSKHFS